MNWTAFLPAVLLISVIPGASQLLGLRNALRYGLTSAAIGLGARLAAFSILIALVAAGLGGILAASATALEIIKWTGVVYLAWLGLTSLLKARRPATGTTFNGAEEFAGRTGGTARAAATGEFFVALSNPKALLLFAALLPQFTTGDPTGIPAQLVALGIAYLGVEGLVGLVYLAAGEKLRGRGISARGERWVDAGAGLLFTALAGFLAAEDVA